MCCSWFIFKDLILLLLIYYLQFVTTFTCLCRLEASFLFEHILQVFSHKLPYWIDVSFAYNIFNFLGSLVSRTLYCSFEESFYPIGETWADQCYNYNCTSEGVFAEPLLTCAKETEPYRSAHCTPVLEPTDRHACCTEEYFCKELILPPRKLAITTLLAITKLL